jgi:mannose-6-phosphate isomerase-like protein (cupin superfamily)
VLEGEGLFNDGKREVTLKPGDTVIFPAGEVHTVAALTQMVLYRVRTGSNRRAKALDAWPA